MNRFDRSLKFGTLSLIYLAKGIGSAWDLKRRPPRSPDDGDLCFVSYSIIPWSGVWQRPQHFAQRLSFDFPLLYVDPVGFQHLLAANEIPKILTPVNQHLTVYRPIVLPGGKTTPIITTLNDAMILKELTRKLQRMNYDRPILITNTPLADRIAQDYPWRAVVYDVIDDFVKASWAPPDAEEREQRLFQRADTVFTGTFSLWEKKKAFHSQIEFIPCGVEIDHFLRANDPMLSIPDDIADIPHPIAGYFGALNERVDAKLLVHLATSYPELNILLIGPVFADFGLSDFREKWASVLPGPWSPGFGLTSKPDNIHIIGIRSYDQLPAYLKAFDVCLLPYILNDVTRDIHPVKILEYLAAGRPVVSTPLPDVIRFYPDVVAIAETPDSFTECVRKSLVEEDPMRKNARIEYARPRTWENMASRMLDKIKAISGITD